MGISPSGYGQKTCESANEEREIKSKEQVVSGLRTLPKAKVGKSSGRKIKRGYTTEQVKGEMSKGSPIHYPSSWV